MELEFPEIGTEVDIIKDFPNCLYWVDDMTRSVGGKGKVIRTKIKMGHYNYEGGDPTYLYAVAVKTLGLGTWNYPVQALKWKKKPVFQMPDSLFRM